VGKTDAAKQSVAGTHSRVPECHRTAVQNRDAAGTPAFVVGNCGVARQALSALAAMPGGLIMAHASRPLPVWRNPLERCARSAVGSRRGRAGGARGAVPRVLVSALCLRATQWAHACGGGGFDA